MAAFDSAQLIEGLRLVLADFEGVEVSALDVDTNDLIVWPSKWDARGPFVECLRVGVSVDSLTDALALAHGLRLGGPTITASEYRGVHLTWDGWVHTDTPAASVVSLHLLYFGADITAAQVPAQTPAGAV